MARPARGWICVAVAMAPACSGGSESRTPADSVACDRMAHALVLAYSGVTGEPIEEALRSVLASPDITAAERDVTEALAEQVALGEQAATAEAVAAINGFVAMFDADWPATGKPRSGGG